MESLTLWFMFFFVGAGLLMMGLSVPLILRRVKPNYWYGFRTPKTMGSERIWYDANAYAGQMLLRVAIVFVAAAIVLCLVLRASFIAYNVACAVVLLSTLSIHVLLIFRHLRSL